MSYSNGMKKSVTNFYNVDDMKTLVKDVLKKEKVATKDDLVSFKDEILHELQGIRTDMDILTG
jgi:hypothetical protein